MPRKFVRLSEIRKVARLQPTYREAASFLGIRVSMLKDLLKKDEKAAQAWEDGKQHGLIALRQAQFRMAEKSSSMSIFLGKQYLGQHEITIHEHSGRDGGPIESVDVSKLDASERKKLRELLTRARKPGSDTR